MGITLLNTITKTHVLNVFDERSMMAAIKSIGLLSCFIVAVHCQVTIYPLLVGSMKHTGNGYNFAGSVTLIRDGRDFILVDTPAGPDAAGAATMMNGACNTIHSVSLLATFAILL